MTGRRERSISIGSVDIAVAMPAETADRISRSRLYRSMIRPTRALLGRRAGAVERAGDEPAPGGAAGAAGAAEPWSLRDVLAHPDGHLRHRRLAAAIRRDFAEGSVLSVGDPFCELGTYLGDGFQVTYTDLGEPYLPPPPGARYLQLDFTADPAFDDRAFDVVASTDVLEHIPVAQRERFVRQAARAARRRAYLSFPAGEAARHIESVILRSPRHPAFNDALLEHAEHGLPEIDEVENLVRGIGVDCEVRPLTTVAEWLTSFVLDPFATEEVELLREYFGLVNAGAADEPGPGPYYRYLVVIHTGGDA